MSILAAFLAGALTATITIAVLHARQRRRAKQRLEITRHVAFVKAMGR